MHVPGLCCLWPARLPRTCLGMSCIWWKYIEAARYPLLAAGLAVLTVERVGLQCAPMHGLTCQQDVPGTGHQDVTAYCTGYGLSLDSTTGLRVNLQVTRACLAHSGILWSVQYQSCHSLYKP